MHRFQHRSSITIPQVILEHMLREGRLGAGHVLAAEAGLAAAEALQAPYAAMHAILARIRARDLGPALAWAAEQRAGLAQDGQPSRFEFQLHALSFINGARRAAVYVALRRLAARAGVVPSTPLPPSWAHAELR